MNNEKTSINKINIETIGPEAQQLSNAISSLISNRFEEEN